MSDIRSIIFEAKVENARNLQDEAVKASLCRIFGPFAVDRLARLLGDPPSNAEPEKQFHTSQQVLDHYDVKTEPCPTCGGSGRKG